MSHDKYANNIIATLEIPPTPMRKEGSFGAFDVGSHASIMTLWCEADAGVISYSIEWDIPGIGETEHIGLEFDCIDKDKKHIVGYDGVCSFPRPAKPWLESLGFTIAEDVE